MTSLEQVSVKHALDCLPSWTGDGDMAEVEEENVGVAITTADEEGEEDVGIAVAPSSPRAENEDENCEDDEAGGSRGYGYGHGHGHEDEDGGVGTSAGGSGVFHRSSGRGVSPLGSDSRSRSRSDSNSRSLSRSSVRGPLEMGESSAATSWVQGDVEGVGERPSGERERERRPSGEGRCRSSTDRVGPEEEDVNVMAVEEPKDGIEVVSSSHLHTGTDERGVGGDVSRKEEVLVMQEEDIGEGWHPLRYNGKARSQEDGEEKGEAEEDVGLAHALESVRGGDQSLEMDEKERWRTFGSSASGRNTRQLRLEFKPPSPQPWDEADPPTDNNEMYASDYYSTLNSKKFGTMQKRCVRADTIGVLLLMSDMILFSVS